MNGSYYLDNLLANFCQEATARHIQGIPGWGFVLQRDGALAHRARDIAALLERFARLHSSNAVTAEFTGSEPSRLYSIWSVLQEKIYCSRVTNVNEVETVRGAGHTVSTKHNISSILSYIYQKLLN